jgi:hypothetical protein
LLGTVGAGKRLYDALPTVASVFGTGPVSKAAEQALRALRAWEVTIDSYRRSLSETRTVMPSRWPLTLTPGSLGYPSRGVDWPPTPGVGSAFRLRPRPSPEEARQAWVNEVQRRLGQMHRAAEEAGKAIEAFTDATSRFIAALGLDRKSAAPKTR